MIEETRPTGPNDYGQLLKAIESIKRQLGRLIVVVSLMTLALILTASAVFGYLVNFFAREPLMWGGATTGAAVLGFVLGWLARRRV